MRTLSECLTSGDFTEEVKNSILTILQETLPDTHDVDFLKVVRSHGRDFWCAQIPGPENKLLPRETSRLHAMDDRLRAVIMCKDFPQNVALGKLCADFIRNHPEPSREKLEHTNTLIHVLDRICADEHADVRMLGAQLTNEGLQLSYAGDMPDYLPALLETTCQTKFIYHDVTKIMTALVETFAKSILGNKPQGQALLDYAQLLYKNFAFMEEAENVAIHMSSLQKDNTEAQLLHVGLLEWARCGFPTIRVGHKMTAALMTSRFDKEAIADIQHPWNAFIVEVPDGLLETVIEKSLPYQKTDKPCIKRIIVMKLNRIASAIGGNWAWLAYDTNWVSLWRFGYSPEMLAAEKIEGQNLLATPYDEKLSHLISRLILGTVCVLTNVWDKGSKNEHVEQVNPGLHQRRKHAREKGKAFSEIAPCVWKIGADVKIDLRERIGQYLHGKGTGKKLEVRVLVHGHWKMQPHGPGRVDRKRLWIHPYERGPKDAPVIIRTKILEKSEKRIE